MKKILLATLAVVSMSVCAFAVDGTVSEIRAESDGTVKLILNKDSGGQTNSYPIIADSADALKTFVAIAMTAKSTGATVSAGVGTINGVTGWNVFRLK